MLDRSVTSEAGVNELSEDHVGDEPGGADVSEGVESSASAYRRALLLVAERAADVLEPPEIVQAMLTVAARSFGGGASRAEGAVNATIAAAVAVVPRGVRRAVAPSGREKGALSTGVERAQDAWLQAARAAGPALMRGRGRTQPSEPSTHLTARYSHSFELTGLFVRISYPAKYWCPLK